jgi:hypothetical protein
VVGVACWTSSFCGCPSHVKKTAAELPEVAAMFREYGWRGDGRKPGALAAEAAKAAEKASEPPMYKVSMCRFMVNGKCQFGDKCTYAHSEAERRQLPSSGPPGRGVKSELTSGSAALSSSGTSSPDVCCQRCIPHVLWCGFGFSAAGSTRYFLVKTGELENLLVNAMCPPFVFASVRVVTFL